MADCISYAMAKKLGIKFLTGDIQFKGMNYKKTPFLAPEKFFIAAF